VENSNNEIERRIAALELEMHSTKEELQLGRRRYHEIAGQFQQYETQLFQLNRGLSKKKWMWALPSFVGAITGSVFAAVVVGAISLLTHLTH
jgi:predicted phage tail protein